MKHLCLAVVLVGCMRVRDAEPVPPAVSDVAYGSDPAMRLDLYIPSEPAEHRPLVVWVHGGAWFTGDKANGMAEKAALMQEHGWALASINYRLSPEPPNDDPARVMYPVHPRDVASAVQWLHEHAPEYGIDPTRIALLGHSAGAHLVALVSTDGQFLAAHGIAPSSIACTGSFDTEAYDIIAALADASEQQRAILHNAFGTDPQVHAEASPITHVGSGASPPFLIAMRGSASRQAVQGSFRDALREAGGSVETIDASELSHAEVNERIGAVGDAIMTPPIVGFLARCFD